MRKSRLQLASALLAAIPIMTGIIGMFGISDPLYASASLPRSTLLDSNLRFFGGVWFGLGVAMYWIIPTIEKQTLLFRALWGMIFIGGIGRLISMLMVGLPPAPFIGFTALEIVGAPLLVLWQARVASRSTTHS
jgi:predicted membrane channel-forming protein YqfA (hemolysin III family)